MDGLPVDCGGCGAHFQLSPSGDVQGAACSECGGTRFFRSQPSATQSDGTLRNMVDSDSQHDQGGNPLGEGTIMGMDGERPMGKRDNYMHSRVAELDPNYNPATWGESYCPECQEPMYYKLDHWHCPSCGNRVPEHWNQAPDVPPVQHPDPWMDNEPGTMTFPQGWTAAYPNVMYEPTYAEGIQHPTQNLHQWRQEPDRNLCPMCGADYSEDKLGYSYHLMEAHPGFGLNNGEFTVAKRVEPMRTLNMEPYAPLWDESYIPKTAGFLAPLLPMAGEALGVGADAGAGAIAGAGLKQMLPKAIGPIMKGVFGIGGGGQGQQAGSEAPVVPTPAPTMEALGSTDIPFLLMSDLETPHSVKSIDEQHDDPEQQDQKEFNDGDKSPSNLQNPNNEDSGMSGEDGVRDATQGYGFGPDSPSIDRASMILPLLLHYFESQESGQNDPLIRGLHDALEKESPGYMDNEDPEGHQAIQLIMQQHKQPHGVHAGVNMMPGMGMPGGMEMGQGGAGGGMGTCPNCGGVLAGDGSCPQCGHKSGTQWGAQPPTGGGVGMPSGGGAGAGASYPPNRVGTSGAGPQTPEQKAAVIQLLEQQGRHGEVQMVELEPWRFAKEMAEIQGNPNVAPLVDPNQAQPQTPPQGMMNPPGGMPVNDPSQMGGGGMPMQPMSAKEADANNAVPRCPKCNSASTTVHALGDNTTDGTSNYFARCHACDNVWQDKTSRVVLTDMANPALDSSLTWQDNQGRPLMVGEVYELSGNGFSVPDVIKVVSKKPDELGVKLVGDIPSVHANVDDNEPDFRITPQQAQARKYTFVPSNEAGNKPDQMGGMPGMEQIPQSGQTTDEATNSYPNRGTVSQVLASDEERYDDLCHKCGGDWIDHVASSPTTTMHECARCGSVWETKDTWQGREANVDLGWLNDSPHDEFSVEMERAQGMRESMTGPSRDLKSIAARDERYQAVKQVLAGNKMSREAGRHFTPGEQRALVTEKGTARNLDDLDLTGTHYTTRYDPTGKSNEFNVPDSHLLLGL